MDVGAVMGVDAHFFKFVCCLLYFLAVPPVEAAEVALKGAIDVFEVVNQRVLNVGVFISGAG